MDYPDSGDVPGPPIQYEEITPDKGRGGYTFADAGNIGEVDQFFYHGDHLSSVVLVTDSKARIVQRLAYTPYGEILLEQSNTDADLPYRFTGKPLDQETGLHYFGARYYDNAACVWLGVDPKWDENIDAGVYVYCHGRPVIFIDPDGNIDKAWWGRTIKYGSGFIAGIVETASGVATVETGVGVFLIVDGTYRTCANAVSLMSHLCGNDKAADAMPTSFGEVAGLTVGAVADKVTGTNTKAEKCRAVAGMTYDMATFIVTGGNGGLYKFREMPNGQTLLKGKDIAKGAFKHAVNTSSLIISEVSGGMTFSPKNKE